MTAWVATSLTGESGLQLHSLPPAECGPDQVRIAARAVALNYPDVLITRGKYQFRPDPPFVPGSEAAGVIAEVGANVEGLAVGDRVLTVCGFGGFTDDLVVAPSGQQVHVIPDAMSFTEAAGFGMVYGTAMHGLRQRGQLRPGETVLVLGSAGGCGSAAVSVAAAMGARVIAAASTIEKCAFAAQLGAWQTVPYGSENLRDRVMALTDNAGVDVVFDPVGGALFDDARRCVGWNGRYLVVGFTAGDIPTLAVNYTLIKSMSVIGVAFGMSAMKDPETNRDNFATLFDWYRNGQLRVAPVSTVPFTAVPEACARLYAGAAVGKIVAEIDRDQP
jgi:NADPH:quinone reductase